MHIIHVWFGLDERFLLLMKYHTILQTIILYLLQACTLHFISININIFIFTLYNIYSLKAEKTSATKSVDKMENAESVNNVSFLLVFSHAE